MAGEASGNAWDNQPGGQALQVLCLLRWMVNVAGKASDKAWDHQPGGQALPVL